MKNLFFQQYTGKKVLVTGNTGFKGTWLCAWLKQMGAIVYGLSLPPETVPNHFSVLESDTNTKYVDIRDKETFDKTLKEIEPDIIFHLAAQALVRKSYIDPISTLNTNIMGTAHLLNSCRFLENLQAVIIVTSDKCYENKEWHWGYREDEAMGGHDPYSASKGCTELVTSSFVRSYFSTKSSPLIASVRAGNVIGGGDWSEDRLVPDLIKNAVTNTPTLIRNPLATRPWQHVLEPLSGYLLVGAKLLQKEQSFAQAYNFGPSNDSVQTVQRIVDLSITHWQKISITTDPSEQPHEAQSLSLDSSKAKFLLKWSPTWNLQQTIQHTMNWYKSYHENNQVLTINQIDAFVKDASQNKSLWTQ